jgi:hypothetical protein
MITLGEVSALCVALIAADKAIELAEEDLKEKKERARNLREESIPMAMQELGLLDLKLTTGEKVSIKQDVYSAIAAENKPQAFQWLEDHDFGGLIKTEVSIAFGKGELDKAIELAEKLRTEDELEASLTRNVHAQTMGAFLREQMADVEKSKDFPLDLFGARPVWVAKIKGSK